MFSKSYNKVVSSCCDTFHHCESVIIPPGQSWGFSFFLNILSVHCSIPMSSSFCICIFAVCFHVWFSYALCHYDHGSIFQTKQQPYNILWASWTVLHSMLLHCLKNASMGVIISSQGPLTVIGFLIYGRAFPFAIHVSGTSFHQTARLWITLSCKLALNYVMLT